MRLYCGIFVFSALLIILFTTAHVALPPPLFNGMNYLLISTDVATICCAVLLNLEESLDVLYILKQSALKRLPCVLLQLRLSGSGADLGGRPGSLPPVPAGPPVADSQLQRR